MSEIPELGELINIVDFKVVDELAKEETGLALGLYLYLDSVPEKPLTGREFLEFWNSLYLPEKMYYLNPLSRHPLNYRVEIPSGGRQLLMRIANNLFKYESIPWWERYVD